MQLHFYLILYGYNWRLEIFCMDYQIYCLIWKTDINKREDNVENREFQDSCNVNIVVYDKELANIDSERISLEARVEGDLQPRRVNISGLVTAKKAEVKGYQKEIDELDAEFEEIPTIIIMPFQQ